VRFSFMKAEQQDPKDEPKRGEGKAQGEAEARETKEKPEAEPENVACMIERGRQMGF